LLELIKEYFPFFAVLFLLVNEVVRNSRISRIDDSLSRLNQVLDHIAVVNIKIPEKENHDSTLD
jgi:hypothetical protein